LLPVTISCRDGAVPAVGIHVVRGPLPQGYHFKG